MKAPVEDLENRLPVWEACSELYLDTDLDHADHQRIGGVFARSRYSMEELNEIMFNEVWPALGPNLLSIAGEWRGWKTEALKELILQKYRPGWHLPWRLHPLKRFFCKDWIAIQAIVREHRQDD